MSSISSLVKKAFASGSYVEMSQEAGDEIKRQLGRKKGTDVSPPPDNSGLLDAPFTQRTAYVTKGELYTNTVVGGGISGIVTDRWEDLGEMPAMKAL